MLSVVLALQALALSALPPTHIFGLLKQLCLAILQVACACAAEVRQVGEWVVDLAVSSTAVVATEQTPKTTDIKCEAANWRLPEAVLCLRSCFRALSILPRMLGRWCKIPYWVGTRHCEHIVACLVLRGFAQLVVIVVEDLQWVDSGTLDMILAFLQEAEQKEPWDGGCMFLLSTRPASTFPAHLSSTRDKIVAERFVRYRTNSADDDIRCPDVGVHLSLLVVSKSSVGHQQLQGKADYALEFSSRFHLLGIACTGAC